MTDVDKRIKIVRQWAKDYSVSDTGELQLWAMGLDLLNRLREVESATEQSKTD
jgi:hypothetical protein